MPDVNLLAVLAAALSSFLLGGIWYSPALFGKTWMAESGMTEEKIKGGNPGLIYGSAFVLSLIAAFVFALFLGPEPALAFAVAAGFAAGLCWVAASMGTSYLFEHRSLRHWAINGGYCVVQYTLFGLILGLWH